MLDHRRHCDQCDKKSAQYNAENALLHSVRYHTGALFIVVSSLLSPPPATASAEGRLIKGGPSLRERVRVRGPQGVDTTSQSPSHPPPFPAGKGAR
jgi:hypothetical protein